ncbi:MAG: isoaspartyl peptidase/L-asparaginase [Bacteroidia bacterium]|nr:isoaspartyl peptidase/L-asparaginase [Bacteroidia bacterium]
MKKNETKPVLVIHGGAGTILKKSMTPEKEKAYRAVLNESLKKGYSILSKGGTAKDAVEAAIRVMEDSPLFNAGKGAVFTHDGKNEMDAAIMDGSNLMAGAVAGVSTIKNPVTAARAVMEKSEHVLMVGKGAEQFCEKNKIKTEKASYFFDQVRWDQLQSIKGTEKTQMDHSDKIEKIKKKTDSKFGTVGAVALDKSGNLAAATSTGGMTNKKFGRVGDCPIIGAGTYANNKTCAVSATGHGEFFIRAVVAYDVSSLMEYKGLKVKKAAEKVVMKKLVKLGGEGGLIALDAKGNIAMPFNSEGMYRGYIKSDKIAHVMIYKEN